MKYSETKKLFFGKYLYKYNIISPFAFHFYRNSNFDNTIAAFNAAIELVEVQLKKSRGKNPSVQIRKWNRSYEVTTQDVNQIKKIAKLLVDNAGEFRTRTEMSNFSIYTNNEALLSLLETNSDPNYAYAIEIFKPHDSIKSIMAGNKEIYVVSKPMDYKYRVTITGKVNNSKQFSSWLKENSDKVKASSTAIRGFNSEYWMSNLLLYVKDDKILLLLQMMIGSSVQKVETIVCVNETTVDA
jgi:hypothetical protein